MKVEGEFTLMTKELKRFEPRLKFDLKVKETRQICVSFNSSLIGKLCLAQSFAGKLKAYSLGKLQCTMNLHANIVCPTVEISHNELNIVNNILPRAYNFTVTNCGEMESNFILKFNESSMIVTKIQEQRQDKLLNVAQSLMKQKCNLKETFFKPDSKEQEVQSILNEILQHSIELKVVTNDEAEIEETGNEKTKNPKTTNQRTTLDDRKTYADVYNSELLAMSCDVEVTLKDIQKICQQLTRAVSETLCNSNDSSRENLATSMYVRTDERPTVGKFLRLSHVKGTLKPQESRVISLYFTGSEEGEN